MVNSGLIFAYAFRKPKDTSRIRTHTDKIKKKNLKVTQIFHLVSISVSKFLTKLAQPYLPIVT